jgi:hypothetical protein
VYYVYIEGASNWLSKRKSAPAAAAHAPAQAV